MDADRKIYDFGSVNKTFMWFSAVVNTILGVIFGKKSVVLGLNCGILTFCFATSGQHVDIAIGGRSLKSLISERRTTKLEPVRRFSKAERQGLKEDSAVGRVLFLRHL